MQVVAPPPARRAFAQTGTVTASWFPVARSRDVGTRRALGLEVVGRRLALWRDLEGSVRALDARCPHLGADLGAGRIEDGALVCPLHGWTFGPDGACQGDDDRPARTVPVLERWGLVWVFNAPEPLFRLPDPPPGRWRVVRPPARTVKAHPHLVVGNGLDAAHFDALHGMDVLEKPVLEVEPPWRVSLSMRGRPRGRTLRRLSGTGDRGEVRFRFTTVGAHLAVADVHAPVRFRALFSATPTEEGSQTQLVLFLPRAPGPFARALGGLYALLHDDAAVLEGLRFRRAFTAADAPLAAFADAVDRLPRGWGR